MHHCATQYLYSCVIKQYYGQLLFITLNDLFRRLHFHGLCNNICYFSHVNNLTLTLTHYAQFTSCIEIPIYLGLF